MHQVRAVEAMTIAEKSCVFESLRKLPAAEGIKVIGSSATPAPWAPTEKAIAGGERMFIKLDMEIAGQPATVQFTCVFIVGCGIPVSEMMGIIK